MNDPIKIRSGEVGVLGHRNKAHDADRTTGPLASCDDQWLTLPQLAAYSGMSVYKLRRHIRNGDFPAYRPAGSTARVLKSEFDAWLRGHRVVVAPSLRAEIEKLGFTTLTEN